MDMFIPVSSAVQYGRVWYSTLQTSGNFSDTDFSDTDFSEQKNGALLLDIGDNSGEGILLM
jgi:hypothetical protein